MSEVISREKFVALVEKHYADHNKTQIEMMINRSSGYWNKLKQREYLRLDTADDLLSSLNLTHCLYTGELETEDRSIASPADSGFKRVYVSTERVLPLLRKEQGDLFALAKRVGVSIKTLQRILNGKRTRLYQHNEEKIYRALTA